MSYDSESLNYMYDESLEEAQFPETSEDFSLSSLFSGLLKEVPVVDTSTGIAVTSSGKPDEGIRSQEEKSLKAMAPMPGTDNVLREALDEKVTMLIQLLHKYQMKEVITKEETLEMVIGEYKDHFFEIFHMASERIALVFGLDVWEVAQGYTLLNKLGLSYDGLQSGNEGIPKTSFLIFVLGGIFMKGNHATEDNWKALNRMDIHAGQNHFLYGETKKLIMKDLVSEKYLDCKKVHSVILLVMNSGGVQEPMLRLIRLNSQRFWLRC
ncbi:PREDICTED: melanoma-associated antigen B16-like [Elephantulus edwardii]|uniref:melanoma-associated antigen B16-like n=1 Tax=Elephantulus edwardii TaxID=28737 RepID=UPI0003F08F25|nr:PREDICTED: melanoma-associated antigen B16-like [Elephantulus edwardii]